jgi:hypothetical protein
MPMPYKSPCGFRDKIQACSFHEEDCTPEKCDMFNLEWTPKAVLQRFKEEQAKVKTISDEMQVFRVNKQTNDPTYKDLKKKLTDLCYGCAHLSKAYVHLKRRGQ